MENEENKEKKETSDVLKATQLKEIKKFRKIGAFKYWLKSVLSILGFITLVLCAFFLGYCTAGNYSERIVEEGLLDDTSTLETTALLGTPTSIEMREIFSQNFVENTFGNILTSETSVLGRVIYTIDDNGKLNYRSDSYQVVSNSAYLSFEEISASSNTIYYGVYKTSTNRIRLFLFTLNVQNETPTMNNTDYILNGEITFNDILYNFNLINYKTSFVMADYENTLATLDSLLNDNVAFTTTYIEEMAGRNYIYDAFGGFLDDDELTPNAEYNYYGVSYKNTYEVTAQAYMLDVFGFEFETNSSGSGYEYADDFYTKLNYLFQDGSFTLNVKVSQNNYLDEDKIYANGYDNGYIEGYNTAYSSAYYRGYTAGYNAAAAEGGAISSLASIFGVFGSAAEALANVLEMEILSGISIGAVLMIPISAALIVWLIKLLRGS